ncbi:MAG: lipopolysaccharide biosynthesis protein, partial [Planctomycetota bacterium]
MLARIMDLFRTRTARHTFTLFFGSAASKGIAFLISFGLAHFLDRGEYGLFSIALTIMWVVFELTELGMKDSLVRHAAEHVEVGRQDRAAGLFRFAAAVKITLWILVLGLGWVLSGTIAQAFMRGPEDRWQVFIAIVGGIGLGGIILLNGVYYSHKQFYKDVVLS